MTALAITFSVATLALASPVYLRLFDHPGVGALLWLIAMVQVGPALALWLADLALARGAGLAWHRRWRHGLYLVALLSFCRQAQVSLALASWPAWSPEPLVMAVVILGATVLVWRAPRALGVFLVAFAPALVIWTVFVVAMLGWPKMPAARSISAASGRPVFVLLFDGLDPAVFVHGGRVAADWPGFSRLAARSLTFTDATANYGSTCHSVAAMLTGRWLASMPRLVPSCLEAVAGLREENLLSDLARERRVIVYGQPLRYCFDGAFECRGTADLQARRPWLPLLQHWVPNGIRLGGVARILGYSEHTYTRPMFERFLDDVTAARAENALFYLHLLLPHHPYVFAADGSVHAPVYPGLSGEREYAEALRAYVAQARFVDRLLGRFLDRLEAQGLEDQSVIAVTSDHGLPPLEPFAPPRRIGGIEVNHARPRVVLMLRAPGLTPGTTAARYQHLDFRPLLSALVHGDRTPAVPGGDARERLFFDGGRWYVRRPDGPWMPRDGGGPLGRGQAPGP